MIKKRLETVFTELAQLPKFIDEENMEELLGALTKAKRIAVLGAGSWPENGGHAPQAPGAGCLWQVKPSPRSR